MAGKDKQSEQEELDALDFGGGGIESDRGSYGDEDEPEITEDPSTEEELEADDEQVDDQDGDDEEVATEDDEESTEDDELEASDPTITIDGKKYTKDELTPELLSKMATHYNQVGHQQKLTKEQKDLVTERDERIVQLELEKQRIEQEWTRKKMAEEFEQRKAAEVREAPKPTPRPDPKVLSSQFEPYLKELKETGRLTEDELDEHSGLISEYIYDTLETRNIIQQITAHLVQRLDAIEGFVNPAIQNWDKEQAIRSDEQIHKEAAAIEDYEELADPETWEKLKAYITRKISDSPLDSAGNPTFNPIFDAETMAEQFDAMQGKSLRAALTAKKKKATATKKADAKKAGGSASSGGKAPRKRPKPKKEPTDADAALDWGDAKYAG